jgi:hypothetical protein
MLKNTIYCGFSVLVSVARTVNITDTNHHFFAEKGPPEGVLLPTFDLTLLIP